MAKLLSFRLHRYLIDKAGLVFKSPGGNCSSRFCRNCLWGYQAKSRADIILLTPIDHGMPWGAEGLWQLSAESNPQQIKLGAPFCISPGGAFFLQYVMTLFQIKAFCFVLPWTDGQLLWWVILTLCPFAHHLSKERQPIKHKLTALDVGLVEIFRIEFLLAMDRLFIFLPDK